MDNALEQVVAHSFDFANLSQIAKYQDGPFAALCSLSTGAPLIRIGNERLRLRNICREMDVGFCRIEDAADEGIDHSFRGAQARAARPRS